MIKRPKEPLEEEADRLLAKYLKDHRKNKTKLEEYPILSDCQLDRRRARELPFSCLSGLQLLKTNIQDDQDE